MELTDNQQDSMKSLDEIVLSMMESITELNEELSTSSSHTGTDRPHFQSTAVNTKGMERVNSLMTTSLPSLPSETTPRNKPRPTPRPRQSIRNKTQSDQSSAAQSPVTATRTFSNDNLSSILANKVGSPIPSTNRTRFSVPPTKTVTNKVNSTVPAAHEIDSTEPSINQFDSTEPPISKSDSPAPIPRARSQQTKSGRNPNISANTAGSHLLVGPLESNL